jgi:hypothetical protein
MTPHHHAPDADAMRTACRDAFLHRQEIQSTGPEASIIVDAVPHFVPGLGMSGEWYRVGALHLLSPNRYLTIYLDAMTGQVQVEQPMLDVVPSREEDADTASQQRAESSEHGRWESEGGSLAMSSISTLAEW